MRQQRVNGIDCIDMRITITFLTLCILCSCRIRQNVFFGDSITLGIGASCPDSSFVNKYASLTRSTCINYGIGGTGLYMGENSMLSRISAIPTHKHQRRIFFGYGANDATGRNGQIDTALFRSAYYNIIDLVAAKRWHKRKIVLFTPYINAANYQDSIINDMLQSIASIKKVKYINVWQAMKGRNLVSPDGVHPTNAGHDAIAKALKK